MSNLTFERLNDDWNAEPNSPREKVTENGVNLRLEFFLNPWSHDAEEGQRGYLTFEQCSRWRMGATNEEGWYNGRCRYGQLAPTWGEFYELLGADDKRLMPTDWHILAPMTSETRHFLFYLKDNTFECLAGEWRFERGPRND